MGMMVLVLVNLGNINGWTGIIGGRVDDVCSYESSSSGCSNRNEDNELGAELVLEVRMVMGIGKVIVTIVNDSKVMVGLRSYESQWGDATWPLNFFFLCVFGWKQITKPSKFTYRKICQTKRSLCRCSLSFFLITDISIMLCQKAPLLSISTQCTSSNKYYSTQTIGNF